MNIPVGTLVKERKSGIRGIVVPCTALGDEAEKTQSQIAIFCFSENSRSIVSMRTINQADIDSDFDFVMPESTINRVLIMADMEGISQVPNDEVACTPAEETGGVRTQEYAAACRAMTLDVQMAIAGARAAGAQEIIVADSHWYDSNLSDIDFDVPVIRGSQAAFRAMEGADAVMLVGWHAKAGTANACLPHTYTDRIASLKIDGHDVGEIGMLTKLAAMQGAEVVLVTGDKAAHQEAQRDAKSALTVISKSVNKDGGVKHRYQIKVWNDIVEKAYTAVRMLANADGIRLTYARPGEFEVTVKSGYAVEPDQDAVLVGEGAYRINAGNVHASYTAFQRFVDRLPTIGVAPLAR